MINTLKAAMLILYQTIPMLGNKAMEQSMGKRENAGIQYFLLFPQFFFYPTFHEIPSLDPLLSSANASIRINLGYCFFPIILVKNYSLNMFYD